MNKRIQKLADEAWQYADANSTEGDNRHGQLYTEKFAELIVQAIGSPTNGGAIGHAVKLKAEAEALRKALTELVRLKDLKERLEAVDPMNWAPEPWEEGVLDEYERCKAPAWKAAREALLAGAAKDGK